MANCMIIKLKKKMNFYDAERPQTTVQNSVIDKHCDQYPISSRKFHCFLKKNLFPCYYKHSAIRHK